jgi:hypothetical protein
LTKNRAGIVGSTTPIQWWSFDGSAVRNVRSEFAVLVKEPDPLERASVEVTVLELDRANQLFLLRRKLDKQAVQVTIETAVGHATRSGTRRQERDEGVSQRWKYDFRRAATKAPGAETELGSTGSQRDTAASGT